MSNILPFKLNVHHVGIFVADMDRSLVFRLSNSKTKIDFCDMLLEWDDPHSGSRLVRPT